LRVVDWVGGEGSKPATGDYIGPSGLVSNIASAVDIRGAQGLTGDTGPEPDILTFVEEQVLTASGGDIAWDIENGPNAFISLTAADTFLIPTKGAGNVPAGVPLQLRVQPNEFAPGIPGGWRFDPSLGDSAKIAADFVDNDMVVLTLVSHGNGIFTVTSVRSNAP
jgi:hypothetical protein